MKTTLVIRIPPPRTVIDANTTVQWGRYTSEGSLIEELHLTAIRQINAALPDECPPEETVLLVNGSLCFYKRLTINSGQKKTSDNGTALLGRRRPGARYRNHAYRPRRSRC